MSYSNNTSAHTRLFKSQYLISCDTCLPFHWQWWNRCSGLCHHNWSAAHTALVGIWVGSILWCSRGRNYAECDPSGVQGQRASWRWAAWHNRWLRIRSFNVRLIQRDTQMTERLHLCICLTFTQSDLQCGWGLTVCSLELNPRTFHDQIQLQGHQEFALLVVRDSHNWWNTRNACAVPFILCFSGRNYFKMNSLIMHIIKKQSTIYNSIENVTIMLMVQF